MERPQLPKPSRVRTILTRVSTHRVLVVSLSIFIFGLAVPLLRFGTRLAIWISIGLGLPLAVGSLCILIYIHSSERSAGRAAAFLLELLMGGAIREQVEEAGAAQQQSLTARISAFLTVASLGGLAFGLVVIVSSNAALRYLGSAASPSIGVTGTTAVQTPQPTLGVFSPTDASAKATPVVTAPHATVPFTIPTRRPGVARLQDRQTSVPVVTPSITPSPTLEPMLSAGLPRVVIAEIHNPPGDDRERLDEEYVLLLNFGDMVNLGGWMLSDKQGNEYLFYNFFLVQNGILRLRTGSGPGRDTPTDLYWGRTEPVWDNDGDTAILRDRLGAIVDRYDY